MMLSNYVQLVIILIIIEIMLQIWFRRNGVHYKKDRKKLAPFSYARGFILIFMFYSTLITFHVEQTLVRDVPTGGAFMYVYPDEEKCNTFSSSFTDAYLGKDCDLTEENYYDKVAISVETKRVSFSTYLRVLVSAPFGIDYADFYVIDVAYKEDTGQILLDSPVTVSANTIIIGDTKLSLEKYKNVISDGDYVQGLLVYDKASAGDGIISRYVLVGGEVDE